MLTVRGQLRRHSGEHGRHGTRYQPSGLSGTYGVTRPLDLGLERSSSTGRPEEPAYLKLSCIPPKQATGELDLQVLVESLRFKVVLYTLKSENKNCRFAGVLSPLPDSNWGPPPYHGREEGVDPCGFPLAVRAWACRV
jgi:hypothetical protein